MHHQFTASGADSSNGPLERAEDGIVDVGPAEFLRHRVVWVSDARSPVRLWDGPARIDALGAARYNPQQ